MRVAAQELGDRHLRRLGRHAGDRRQRVLDEQPVALRQSLPLHHAADDGVQPRAELRAAERRRAGLAQKRADRVGDHVLKMQPGGGGGTLDRRAFDPRKRLVEGPLPGGDVLRVEQAFRRDAGERLRVALRQTVEEVAVGHRIAELRPARRQPAGEVVEQVERAEIAVQRDDDAAAGLRQQPQRLGMAGGEAEEVGAERREMLRPDEGHGMEIFGEALRRDRLDDAHELLAAPRQVVHQGVEARQHRLAREARGRRLRLQPVGGLQRPLQPVEVPYRHLAADGLMDVADVPDRRQLGRLHPADGGAGDDPLQPGELRGGEQLHQPGHAGRLAEPRHRGEEGEHALQLLRPRGEPAAGEDRAQQPRQRPERLRQRHRRRPDLAEADAPAQHLGRHGVAQAGDDVVAHPAVSAAAGIGPAELLGEFHAADRLGDGVADGAGEGGELGLRRLVAEARLLDGPYQPGELPQPLDHLVGPRQHEGEALQRADDPAAHALIGEGGLVERRGLLALLAGARRRLQAELVEEQRGDIGRVERGGHGIVRQRLEELVDLLVDLLEQRLVEARGPDLAEHGVELARRVAGLHEGDDRAAPRLVEAEPGEQLEISDALGPGHRPEQLDIHQHDGVGGRLRAVLLIRPAGDDLGGERKVGRSAAAATGGRARWR